MCQETLPTVDRSRTHNYSMFVVAVVLFSNCIGCWYICYQSIVHFSVALATMRTVFEWRRAQVSKIHDTTREHDIDGHD